MYRIDYSIYGNNEQVAFADTEDEAHAMAEGLGKLKHVSGVVVTKVDQPASGTHQQAMAEVCEDWGCPVEEAKNLPANSKPKAMLGYR